MENPTDKEKYYIARINVLISLNEQLQDQLANTVVELQKLRDASVDNDSASTS